MFFFKNKPIPIEEVIEQPRLPRKDDLRAEAIIDMINRGDIVWLLRNTTKIGDVTYTYEYGSWFDNNPPIFYMENGSFSDQLRLSETVAFRLYEAIETQDQRAKDKHLRGDDFWQMVKKGGE